MSYQRLSQFLDAPQLSLGKLIAALEAIPAPDSGEPEMLVLYDFPDAYPTNIASWRGSYAELALGWAIHGSTVYERPSVPVLLQRLRVAVGKVFTGYKGGDYRMTEATPVWVDNHGTSNSTAIVGVLNLGWGVVLQTAYCEF